MKNRFFGSLDCILKSKVLMLAHPSWTLWLIALAALLSIMASLLGSHVGLSEQLQPDDIDGLLKRSLLNLAVLFPLELYFLPRWILAMDASVPSAHSSKDGGNSKDSWRQLFEERWGRVFLARLMVAAAASIGFFFCIAPGVLVLIFFGWTPWRVLLHGEPILLAAKASARRMAMLWPRVLMAAVALMMIVLLFNGMATNVSAHIGGHLGQHASNVVSQMSMIWMNAALLGLYQWMEAEYGRRNAANL